VLGSTEVSLEVGGGGDAEEEGWSLWALTRTLASPASPNAHCGASEMSTVFIATAYPRLVNVSLGQVK
jgi:hypothetical protein